MHFKSLIGSKEIGSTSSIFFKTSVIFFFVLEDNKKCVPSGGVRFKEFSLLQKKKPFEDQIVVTEKKNMSSLTKQKKKQYLYQLVKELSRHAVEMLDDLFAFSNKSSTTMERNIKQLARFSREDIERELSVMPPSTRTLMERLKINPIDFLSKYFKIMAGNYYCRTGKIVQETSSKVHLDIVKTIVNDTFSALQLNSKIDVESMASSRRTWTNLSVHKPEPSAIPPPQSGSTRAISQVSQASQVSHPSRVASNKAASSTKSQASTSFFAKQSQIDRLNGALSRLNKKQSASLSSIVVKPDDSVSNIHRPQIKRTHSVRPTPTSRQSTRLTQKREKQLDPSRRTRLSSVPSVVSSAATSMSFQPSSLISTKTRQANRTRERIPVLSSIFSKNSEASDDHSATETRRDQEEEEEEDTNFIEIDESKVEDDTDDETDDDLSEELDDEADEDAEEPASPRNSIYSYRI